MARPERSAMDESSVRCNVGGGGNFLRQITMTFPVNFEMSMGEYVVDMGNMTDFRGKVNLQYPSLKHLRNLTFFPTGNKVLRDLRK